MAMVNPKGRVNYEPNSFGGPRENPKTGFVSYPQAMSGNKVRARSESFSDHYSQARQFYISQTKTEQTHIKDALVFELSKVEKAAIRERMVSHLENIDRDLAAKVAEGLGMKTLPAPAKAAKPTKALPPSPALSIILNGPSSFKGRTVGVLMTDGADAKLFAALKNSLQKEGASLQVVAPTIGGVDLNDGTHIPADHKIDGGPSVLFDAVAILVSDAGAAKIAPHAPAKDFISDAFAHMKFIAFNSSAAPLLAKAGVAGDEGVIELTGPADSDAYVAACRKLRLWTREDKVKMASTP